MDPKRSEVPIVPFLVAGVIAGVAGLLTFLVIHHFLIRPIWFILPAGLLMASLGGLAVGWSYSEVHTGLPPRPWTAIAFACLIVLILAPSVIISELRIPILDASTFSIPLGEGGSAAARFVLELVLPSLLAGAAAGWFLGHSPRAALATSVAGIAFALGPGHNIPFLGHTPAAGKGLLLLLAITLISSIVLVEAVQALTGRWK